MTARKPTHVPRPNPRLDDYPRAARRNAAPLGQRENDWRDHTVIPFARFRGWKVYFTWRSKNSPSGWPDLALCRPPRLILAELKAADGIVSPAQRGWLDVLEACPGVEVFVWCPADWPMIEAILT